jgi:hypothetical protein
LTSAAIAGAVILGALALSDGAQGAVPNPVVTGPIPALAAPGDASHNYPFFSTAVDLVAAGYIEEEFFFEGTANRYNMPPLTTATILDSGHPYRTRMIVRRPASASGFNGIVVMEWQNVTAGYDFDAGWVGASDYYIRRGFAWIGVSAQHVGIDQPVTGLRYWSPTRYGTLDVTQGGAILNDALSYDIFSQAAQAVRSPAGVSPLGGLYANLVLAAGVSQAAIRGLAPYYNSIQPLAGVFDGFLLVSGGGLLRTDLTVKAFKGLSESDVATGGNQVGVSQPDSDHFRTWEVAGTSHLDHSFQQAVFPLQVRDSVTQIPANPPCTLPAFSRIPFQYVMNAATGHIIAWVQYNTAPPTAPQITRDLASPTMIARDSFGNALGGIRLSQHAVPTAVNTGVNSPANTFCRLFGSYQPFDQPTLHTLYRNHGAYVSEVSNVTDGNVSNGFLVQEDADVTIQEAAHSEIGKP